MFRKFLIVTLALCFSGLVIAGNLERAQRVADKLSYWVGQNATMVGVGLCDRETGETTLDFEDTVYCVFIGAEDEFKRIEFLQIYPPKTKIDGVFVTIGVQGEISTSPRMGGGN